MLASGTNVWLRYAPVRGRTASDATKRRLRSTSDQIQRLVSSRHTVAITSLVRKRYSSPRIPIDSIRTAVVGEITRHGYAAVVRCIYARQHQREQRTTLVRRDRHRMPSSLAGATTKLKRRAAQLRPPTPRHWQGDVAALLLGGQYVFSL